jgi:hypothetical protein
LDQVFDLLLTTASGDVLVDKMINFKGLIISVITIGDDGVWMV